MILRLTLFLLLSLSLCANDNPNILFILADDLGSQSLNCYGNEFMETPNIDQLAKDGMRFTQGYANCATCKPSRAAIFSGQYAPRTKIYRVVDRHKGLEQHVKFQIPKDNRQLSLETVTMAEALKPAGYKTALFGKWHLGEQGNHPLKQGYDVAIKSHKTHFNFKTDPHVDHDPDEYVADFMTDRGIEFMEACHKKNTPFFLTMTYFQIHGPYQAKADDLAHFQKKFGDKYEKKIPIIAAMLKNLDDNVGRLVKTVNDLGIAENTLIVFTSDNGGYKVADNILNGELREYKGQIYEGGIRVPYIFKWPGKIKASSIHNERIIGIDLFPTFLDYAGLSTKQDYPLDGVSLKPLLNADQSKLEKRSLYWFYPKWGGFNKKSKTWGDSWRNVIIDGDHKLIEHVDHNSLELYDLKNDLREQNDLAQTQPEKAQELLKKLDLWKKAIKAIEPTLNPNYSP